MLREFSNVKQDELDKFTTARFETELVLICRLVYCLVF